MAMEPINIEPSRTTPKVTFLADEGALEISGQSYPENAVQVFNPINEWVQTYLAENPDGLRVNFRLDYFNTSSSKCLLDLLEILEAHHKEHENIKVVWYYEEDDEDMEDSGHDFGADLDLPFELVAYSEDDS